jgi:hypothetical protein
LGVIPQLGARLYKDLLAGRPGMQRAELTSA